MSSLDRSTAKTPAASSNAQVDPALERGTPDAALSPPGAPTPGAPPPAADGSLYLQNAHLGALETQAPHGVAGQGSNAGSAPPPAALTLSFDATDTPPPAPQGSAGNSPQAFDPAATGSVHQSAPQTVDQRALGHESFSLKTGGQDLGSTPQAPQSANIALTSFEGESNGAPVDIALSNASVDENAAGAVVGMLTTVDPDAGETFTYTVSDDRFEVVDGALKLKDGVALDHEGEPTVTITVTSTDSAGHTISESFTIAVANINETPTDIGLSNATISENAAGAIVGALSVVDPDAGDTHSYSVSDDRFEVVDGHLKLKDGVSLDHEGEPSVTVHVTATDAGGLSVGESFTVTVANVNEGPTDIGLSNAIIDENAAGAVVGALSTVDPDAGDSHTYLVSDGRFEVVDGVLKVKADVFLDHEAEPSVNVQVTSTDAGGLSVTENFTITVANVNETPSNILLSNATVAENAAGAVIGALSASDPDAGDSLSFSVSDSRFEVVGGQLKLKAGVSLDYEATPSVSVDVTATDSGGLSVTQNFTIAVSDVVEINVINGTPNNDTLVGTAGVDLINGLAGNDNIQGGGGDDFIVAGAGNDTLDGGAGSDTYRTGTGAGFDRYSDTGSSGTDVVVATANNVAIGLQSGFGPTSGIEEISSGGFANVSIQGNTSNDTLDFSNTTLTGIVKIDGGSGNDTITGSAAGDVIVGGAGNDTLRGGDGGDTYELGTGAGVDNIVDTGATGTDRIVATANNVAIGIQSGFGPTSGIEEISANGFSGVSIQGGSSGETFDFSATTLTGISKIDGGAGNDTITGSAGDDTIVGGAGNDTLRGGGGSDTYQIGAGAGVDNIADTGASGTDRIVATANNVAIGLASGFGPASGIEEISAGGFTGVSIQGGSSGETFDFSATTLTGVSKIDGGAGNDTITGSAGDDTIVGGAGNDTLRGGGGSDTYQIGAGAGVDNILDTGASGTDRIVATAANVAIGLTSGFGAANGIEEISAGGFANVTIQGGSGNETFNFSGATLTGLARIDGGAGNDTITGSAGADTIVGGAGNDTLSGGDGNDTITGGTGSDILSGGAGVDTVSYAASAAGVTVNLAANTASGGDAQGDTISGFENVTGSAFDDTISGDANNNVIDAGAGNDRVYSSWGLDTIDGGAGLDTIDLAIFNGQGNMTMDLAQGLVYFTGYVAGADHVSNFENASGTTGDDTFIGSAGDNVMTGQAGNDTFWFSANAGHDTAQGGAGSDFIRIDTGGGSGGWLETIADGSTPTLAAGDWLLQLDSGATYVLHGAGADFDFGGVHAGVLTAADGSTMTFQEIEGLHW